MIREEYLEFLKRLKEENIKYVEGGKVWDLQKICSERFCSSIPGSFSEIKKSGILLYRIGQKKQGSFPYKNGKYDIRNRLEAFFIIFFDTYPVWNTIPEMREPFVRKT